MTMYDLVDLCFRYGKLSQDDQAALDAVLANDITIDKLQPRTQLRLSMFLNLASRAGVDGAAKLHKTISEKLKEDIKP